MEEQGFSKTITSDTKTEYHLIDGEYFYESSNELTSSQILNKAKTAIQKTNKSYKVFVSKTSSMRWEGLDKVED
ncbi:hypothetical protein HZP64_14575 [Elizabethkingia anophelis]|nr:hypothetical protein [Elizabethkingia anophelis]